MINTHVPINYDVQMQNIVKINIKKNRKFNLEEKLSDS